MKLFYGSNFIANAFHSLLGFELSLQK